MTRAAGWALLALAAVTVLRLVVAGLTPLSPDEAYYWVWSRALAPGYLDHPPMVALWIRAGTMLAGQGALGIRLLGPLSAALGSVLLARAAEDLLPGRRAGLLAAALMNATLLFGVGTVTMTPDTPLLFFWTLTLWAMARLIRTGQGGWWLVAGIAAGLAMDSKYTAALLPAGIGLWLILVPGAQLPGAQRWLLRWQPWAGGVLAALVFLPVLAWNAAHGWASFVKQGGRTGEWAPARALQYLGELIGGQAGLATPLVFLLCMAGIVVALRQAVRTRDPGWSLLAALTVPPVLIFVQHALGDRVQANWPAILYPAAAIAAAGLAGGWRRLAAPAVALGAVLTVLVYVQAVAAPLRLSRHTDPTLMRLAGWPGLAEQVAAASRAQHAAFVATDEYGLAATLARLLPPNIPVVGVEPRWVFFDLPDAGATLDGSTGLLLRSARRHDAPAAARWSNVQDAQVLKRARDGVVAESYHLYRVTGRPGGDPAVLIPRP